MKPDLVIHSSDANPFYLDFWPLVSKVWRVRFGIEPLLVFIGDETTPISEEYGRVIRIPPIADVPMYLQTQWVRFWIPSQFPEKVCLLSDIDMFPISKKYFLAQVESIPDSKYVHLNPDQDIVPVCYHMAKGSTFTKVLDLEDSWEHSIRTLYSKNMGHDCSSDNPTNPILKGKTQWGADEEYTTRKFLAYPDASVFVFIIRHHGRLDRSDWFWTPNEISRDLFADAHSIRPYSEHKGAIDFLVDVLTR